MEKAFKSLSTTPRVQVVPNIAGTIDEPQQEQEATGDSGLNLLSTASAVSSPAGVWYRTAAEPPLLEIVGIQDTKEASGVSKANDPAPQPEEVAVSSPEHHLVEEEKKPKRLARGKGGILYSSIDELESEEMSASVQQYDLLVETPSPLHAADRRAAIMENIVEEHKSTLKASDLTSSSPSADTRGHVSREAEDGGMAPTRAVLVPRWETSSPLHTADRRTTIMEENILEYESAPKASDLRSTPPSADTRGHVSREAEDGGDGADKGCAGSSVDGDDGRKTKGVHDGSGDHAGEADQGSSCGSRPPSQYDAHDDGGCCHHTETATVQAKKCRHAVALEDVQEEDKIQTRCATELDDHKSRCDLAGCAVPSSTSMMGPAKVNKMGSSHVVIILS
ncbi:Hypp3700 [Branchiostoma lanceolatum]|uniref:Hypp3700 protein n=1 Tax=Branchiostoma lanceolatum TaxID=7740 RepID=A0A8K0EYE9_BRALA|nr:Hypp3700 [Branchiostoma lanceolatum]